MDAAKADDLFGAIVHKTDKTVVRAKKVGQALRIYTHKIDSEGVEQWPAGYLLGVNCLIVDEDK